eukprot:7374591-Lingulodinium_polyedra.AAC.1
MAAAPGGVSVDPPGRRVMVVAQGIFVFCRGKEEARDVVRSLDRPSVERALLLAMLAGVADESLIVTRMFGNEEVDVSAQQSDV